MNPLVQAIIGIAVILPASWWAIVQWRCVAAGLAVRQTREVVLSACRLILEDEKESKAAKAFATRIARFALNNQMLAAFAKNLSHHVKSEHHFAFPGKSQASRQVLEGATKCLAVMALAYHPSLGAQTRAFLRSKNVVAREQNEVAKPVVSVKPPKSIASTVSETIEAICDSFSDRRIAI